MANPKKRRSEPQREELSDSDDGSTSEQEIENEEIVQVDFEAYPPTDGDFHWIKSLLQQLFLKAHVNLSELANLLIKQNYVTSVLKQADEGMDDDDDFSFGVFSVINLTYQKELECIQQTQKFLLDHCRQTSNDATYKSFESMMNNTKNVGLIISERLSNVPVDIAIPLYQTITQDMEKARQENKPFDFEHYILICKISTFSDEDKIFYTNGEEEVITEEATLWFDFSVSEEQDSGLGGKWRDDDAEGQPGRRVLVLPAERWSTILAKITAIKQ